MRVLVFTTVFPSPARPLRGLFVLERVRHAARHAEVRVVAPVAWYRRAERRSVPAAGVQGGLPVEYPTFFYLPLIGKVLDGLLLFFSVVGRVRRLRREFDFELIDAHFGYPDGVAAALLGWWFRRPVVVTLRGSEIDHARSPLKRRALAWALGRATRVITVSHALADLATGLGVPASRLRVIPNGVDAVAFAPRDRAQCRRELGLPEGDRLLLSVGNLIPLKGFHRVLRALPDVCRAVPEVRYAIVGAGERRYEAELHRLARDLGVADRVVFAGSRPPREVALWMGAADVLVLSSSREGCPNVVWEAMACGRPVVATRVGEVERMVPEGAGVLCDPDDDDQLRAGLVAALRRPWDGRLIRAHAERHTWPDVAERVAGEWETATGQASCEGPWPPGAEPGGKQPAGVGQP